MVSPQNGGTRAGRPYPPATPLINRLGYSNQAENESLNIEMVILRHTKSVKSLKEIPVTSLFENFSLRKWLFCLYSRHKIVFFLCLDTV